MGVIVEAQIGVVVSVVKVVVSSVVDKAEVGVVVSLILVVRTTQRQWLDKEN